MSLRACMRLRAAAALCAAVVLLVPASAQQLDFGVPRHVAPGLELYHLTTPSLVDPAGPLSIWALRVDPALADLRAALANDEVVGIETVADTAARHGATAAINAGFFLPNGDPQGLFKLNGQLVSDTRRPRGAVGIIAGPRGWRLIFDRVTARATLAAATRSRSARVPIDGVDTTRLRGKLMLFTPAYNEHTDTAAGGVEWVLDGAPLQVVSGPHREGRTPIPRSGFVLSFGGATPPSHLGIVRRGARVQLETTYDTLEGPAAPWREAAFIIGGAGLLARDGRYFGDWTVEQFTRGFADMRHPRTMIGTSRDGGVWLVTVDGRQPEHSVGMTLVELRELARRLGLTNALNLDGGGSTTMWIRGEVVNRPSDAAGPRQVSDALLVFRR